MRRIRDIDEWMIQHWPIGIAAPAIVAGALSWLVSCLMPGWCG